MTTEHTVDNDAEGEAGSETHQSADSVAAHDDGPRVVRSRRRASAPKDPAKQGPGGSGFSTLFGENRDLARRVVWIVLILGALVGIFFTGKAATTGLDSASGSLPDQVDRLIPESGAEVLRQSQVGIDVAAGYDAYLIINGVEVRSAQDGLIRDLGTGLVLLQPGPGKAIEVLNEGRNCVIAMVWDQLENEKSAVPVSWCFNAT